MQSKCVLKVMHKMLDSIELIQTLDKFMLEISPNAGVFSQMSESWQICYYLSNRSPHIQLEKGQKMRLHTIETQKSLEIALAVKRNLSSKNKFD